MRAPVRVYTSLEVKRLVRIASWDVSRPLFFSVIISAWTLQCVIYGRETGLTNTDSANLAGYEY